MGPDTYDLASLLRDSYVDIADRELDDLIAYFLALRGHGGGTAAAGGEDAAEFRRRFDLMALQRDAAGRTALRIVSSLEPGAYGLDPAALFLA